jgi:hypothetical protein
MDVLVAVIPTVSEPDLDDVPESTGHSRSTDTTRSHFYKNIIVSDGWCRRFLKRKRCKLPGKGDGKGTVT